MAAAYKDTRHVILPNDVIELGDPAFIARRLQIRGCGEFQEGRRWGRKAYRSIKRQNKKGCAMRVFQNRGLLIVKTKNTDIATKIGMIYTECLDYEFQEKGLCL